MTYVNAVDPLAAVYDGFLVHGRTGAGAALDTRIPARRRAPTAPASRSAPTCAYPVIVLQTETDVTLLGSGRADQPDGDLLRNWEMAGAAHADTYLLFASGQDDGSAAACPAGRADAADHRHPDGPDRRRRSTAARSITTWSARPSSTLTPGWRAGPLRRPRRG